MRTSTMFALALGLTVATLQPALSVERGGTTTIAKDGRKAVHSFEFSFDRRTGELKRIGKLQMPNGRIVLSYELNGDCDVGATSCDLEGRAVGPFGGEWTGTGKVFRSGTKVRVVAHVTTPAGKTIAVERQADGDAFPEIFNVK